MSEQTLVPAEMPADHERTADPTHGWDGRRAAEAGLVLMSARPPLGEYLRDLWSRRELIVQMPLADWRQQHMNTVLGALWHLLGPLMLSAIYYLIFGIVLNISRGNIENYPIYLICGIITYRFTQKCVQQGSKAIVKNEKLLQNIRFPAAVLPLTSTITETLAQGPALLVIIGFALATGEAPSFAWLLLVPITMVQSVFNFGLATIIARITVHFRDTEELLRYILRIGFYLSGVIIGPERIPEDQAYDWIRTVYVYNPAYAFITVVRELVMEGRFDPFAWSVCAGWTVVVLLVGFVYFWRYEGRYANAV